MMEYVVCFSTGVAKEKIVKVSKCVDNYEGRAVQHVIARSKIGFG